MLLEYTPNRFEFQILISERRIFFIFAARDGNLNAMCAAGAHDSDNGTLGGKRPKVGFRGKFFGKRKFKKGERKGK